MQCRPVLAALRRALPGGVRRAPGQVAHRGGAADRKAAFRQASLRWHPDKFQAKYGRLLHDDEREAIMDKVTETFQAINDANG